MKRRPPVRWAWLALVVTMIEITGCTTYFTMRQPTLYEFSAVITPTVFAWLGVLAVCLLSDMRQAAARARRYAAEEAARADAFERIQAAGADGSNQAC